MKLAILLLKLDKILEDYGNVNVITSEFDGECSSLSDIQLDIFPNASGTVELCINPYDNGGDY